MPNILLNFGSDPAWTKPVPNGVYPAVIDTSKTELKQGPKAAYVNLCFTISGGPHNERQVWQNYMVSKENNFRLKKLLRILGYEIPDEGEHQLKFSTDELHGKRCRIKTKITTFEGRERNEIDEVLPAEDPESDVAF